MTTTARPISILFVTPIRRSMARPALGFDAPPLPLQAGSPFDQPSPERSRRPTPAFQSFDDRQSQPFPPAKRGACANTARALSP
jgi:hypothetical protein